MSDNQPQPCFVNLQDTPVTIPDENHRPRYVQPWSQRGLSKAAPPEGQTVEDMYMVQGAHYQQFAEGGKGPLYPFRGNAASLPAITKSISKAEQTALQSIPIIQTQFDAPVNATEGSVAETQPEAPEATQSEEDQTVNADTLKGVDASTVGLIDEANEEAPKKAKGTRTRKPRRKGL